jgi:plasmid stabilization system protein ParE
MKKYKVILHSDAESDIESSFKWGCRAWGEENAKLWVRKLRRLLENNSHHCHWLVLSRRRANNWVFPFGI